MTATQEMLGKIRGFSRVQIVNSDGSLDGDSGWCGPNTVVNLGFNQFLVLSLGTIAGSKYISHAALGSGTAPGAADTALESEVVGHANARAAVTAASSSGSKTLRLTATFASSQSFVTATRNIANIGLFNTSAVTVGTIFAGNTFASSSCATNQAVNCTYDIIFS